MPALTVTRMFGSGGGEVARRVAEALGWRLVDSAFVDEIARGLRATPAVAQAIAGLEEGDVLLIAGKGHETGQIVKGTIIPYSDHDAVDAALRGDGDRG